MRRAARLPLSATAATLLTAALWAPFAAALPPADPEPGVLMEAGEPVTSIPSASAVQAFRAIDDAHVMLTTEGDRQYLLTLNRACVGLRWARHVGVTASDNTIWAGFDALTADGEACPIREIHLIDRTDESSARL
ncbi:MAG: DUF6491 family protein [Pseudomonadales bacterium]